jgi:hypothetical protein
LETVQALFAAEPIDTAKLKQQAETAIQAGDLAEAEEKLRQVRELDPSDTEVAQQYAQIRQQRTLKEKLRSIEREADSKLAGNSPVDAMHTLRRGLSSVLEPDVDLPERAREILSTLVALGDRDDGLALGQAENWQSAQDMTAELGSLRSESWIIYRILPLVDQWIRQVRDNALRGIVASSAQLGNLLEAYRGATAYLKAHPTEAFAIQQLTERQESLVNQLNESASKRIYRAQTALDDGEFEAALHNLRDIEADFYHPVEKEFPGFLDGYDRVQDVRYQTKHLQIEAERLRSEYRDVSAMIEKSEIAFAEGDFDRTVRVLETIPETPDLPVLTEKVVKLRKQVHLAQVDQARRRLRETNVRIETGLRLATNLTELDRYLEVLNELQQQVDLRLLSAKKQNAYFDLLRSVRERREFFAEIDAWEKMALQAFAERNYEHTRWALEQALSIALSQGPTRARLQSRLSVLSDGIKQQEALIEETEEVFKIVKRELLQGDLDKAATELHKLPDLQNAPYLMSKMQLLNDRVMAMRRQRAQDALEAVMFEINSKIQRSLDQQTLASSLQRLEELRTHVDFEYVSPSNQKEYLNLLEQVQSTHKKLTAIAQFEKQVEKAIRESDYPAAIRALESALEITVDGEKRALRENRLQEIKDLYIKRQKYEHLFLKGKTSLAERRYDEAVKPLAEALSVYSEAEDYLHAAYAGKFLVEGQKYYKDGELKKAEYALQQTLQEAKGRDPATSIASEAYRLLNKLASAKVTELINRAKESAERLDLGGAVALWEQAEEAIKRMEEDYAVLMTSELKSVQLVQVRRELANTRNARELLRSVEESRRYLEQDFQSKQAYKLLMQVLNYPDQSPTILRIKDEAQSLLDGSRVWKGEYKFLRLRFAQRVIENPGDASAREDYDWIWMREKFEQEWDSIHETEEQAISEITKRLYDERKVIQLRVDNWEKVSIAAGITALIFTIGAVIWMIQQQYPWAYVSGIGAILVAVVEPLMLRMYISVLNKQQSAKEDLVKRLEEYETNAQERRQILFDKLMDGMEAPELVKATAPMHPEILQEHPNEPTKKITTPAP